MATDKYASAPWQTRPVFVSSTFKDMQAERDHLRHAVFPRLEEELRKGRLLLEPIDLRQGVETADLANEETREQLVLKVCLEEIQRSRPFLIVLLGDRYGWVPPEERMAAATQEVGFAADVRDKSVTALEIEFGILKQSPEQRQRSFFYFRDPLPYDQMPPDVAASYSDEYSTDPQTRARHGRLAALKQSLAEDSELAPRVHNYHADCEVWTGKVTGLEAWGELVYQHLLGELQTEIAAAASQPPQTWEDQERLALAEFIEHRRRDFTGREQLLDDLTNLARSETPPGAVFALASGVTWGACLTGDPGSGKSAIFAELVTRLSADDIQARRASECVPNSRGRETSDESVLLLTNAAGATPRGSQVEAMLERFIQELAAALGIANPLPEKATPDDVDATFASLLGRVAVKRRVVVLLDALNQFDPTPRAQHLTWLRPKQWPGNARLIATGLAGVRSDRSVGGSPAFPLNSLGEPPELRPTEALSQWAGIEKLEVPPLTITDDDTDDVTAIARAVWRRYHRQVNPAVLRVLKDKRLPDGSFAAGNPLWLTLALEQINLLDADDFARAERDFSGCPAERMRAMLIDTAERMPPTVAELYDLLLAQSERLFGVAPTRAFAAVIAVSRFGWRETDLLALIPAAARVLCPGEPSACGARGSRASTPASPEQPNPVAREPRAPQESELDDLRLAALRRSFRAHLARRGTLEQLDFFHAQMRQAVTQRLLTDLELTQTLHRTIADHLETLPELDPLRTSELMIHLIAGDDRRRAARVYADLPAGHPSRASATGALAGHVLLGAKSQPNPGTAWITSLLTQPDLTDHQLANLANRFNFDLHDAIATTTDLATRETLLQAAQAALQRLAAASSTDDPDRTITWWQRLLNRIFPRPPNNAAWQRELSVSLGKLGELATAQGVLPNAKRLWGDAYRITQRLAESDPANAAWQRDLSVSLINLGELATAQGNLSEAQRLFGESLRITQRLAESDPANASWQRDLSVSFNKLGDLATAQGNLSEAQRLFDADLRIVQRLAESDLTNAAWQRDLAQSHCGIGKIQQSQGNLSKAKESFERYRDVIQRLAESDPANAEWQRDLSVSFYKLGNLATTQGNLPDAQRLFGESLRIAQRLAESDPANAEWQRGMSVLFDKLGNLATAQGNLSEAQRRFGETLRIAQRLAESDPAHAAWQRDLSVSFNKLGDLAKAQGNLSEAQRLFGEALRIRQRLAESDPANAMWQNDLSVSLSQLGNLATTQGNLSEAQRLFGEALRILQRLAESDATNAEWQRDLAQSHCWVGNTQQSQGNLSNAKESFTRYRDVMQCLAESDPANAEWQRDLSVSLYKLGNLATTRGNLPEAQRLFGESLRIAQRLAESDPANAAWQRDLAVSHHELAMFARQCGDETGFEAELRKCFLVLVGMRQRCLNFDPPMAQVYQQLAAMFGD